MTISSSKQHSTQQNLGQPEFVVDLVKLGGIEVRPLLFGEELAVD